MMPAIAAAPWVWCAALIVVTIAIHVTGIALLVRATRRFWADAIQGKAMLLDSTAGFIWIVVTVAITLAILHGIECWVWAVAYVQVGAIPSPAAAMLYSVDSMTTRGSSGLLLQPEWRIMGAVEAGDGMLLFGISTAVIFAVMVRLWKSVASRPLF